jgi:hypothetical protein
MTEQGYDWLVPSPDRGATSPVTSLVLTSVGAALVVLGVVGTPAGLLKTRALRPLQLGLVALGGGLFVAGMAALVGVMTAA